VAALRPQLAACQAELAAGRSAADASALRSEEQLAAARALHRTELQAKESALQTAQVFKVCLHTLPLT
jgi:hypothetical protein